MQRYCSVVPQSQWRGSALFTEKISRAVVNKLRWKSWEFKANALSMWRTACKSRGKHFPDNSPAITRSLKTPSINPPARHVTQQHGASLGQDAGPQRPTLTGNRKIGLPVDDHGVLRVFRSCFHSFFVTTPTWGEEHREKEKETWDEIWENQQTACMCLSSPSTVCFDLFIWHALSSSF